MLTVIYEKESCSDSVASGSLVDELRQFHISSVFAVQLNLLRLIVDADMVAVEVKMSCLRICELAYLVFSLVTPHTIHLLQFLLHRPSLIYRTRILLVRQQVFDSRLIVSLRDRTDFGTIQEMNLLRRGRERFLKD
jgi:hypothetical protein